MPSRGYRDTPLTKWITSAMDEDMTYFGLKWTLHSDKCLLVGTGWLTGWLTD